MQKAMAIGHSLEKRVSQGMLLGALPNIGQRPVKLDPPPRAEKKPASEEK